MSHPTVWPCHGCKRPLGEDRGGELRIDVAGARLGRDGVLRVPCPTCGQVRSRPWPAPVESGRSGG